MRPRHKAAENCGRAHPRDRGPGASMRPRHKAAENGRSGREDSRAPEVASMRPRHKAAENGWCGRCPATTGSCFNEAAA